MRKLVILFVVGLVSVCAQAELLLEIDMANGGAATITNIGGSPVVGVDGYEIFADNGVALDPTSWSSIEDQVDADQAGMEATWGANISDFVELSATATGISEGNLSSTIDWPAGQVLNIGDIIAGGATFDDVQQAVDSGDLSFEYSQNGAGSAPGQIRVVPEPATMGLLAIGAVAGLIRRRK